ncbi:MAG: hypothetical protein V8T45_05885 [Oscillospiraceae bacterium]
MMDKPAGVLSATENCRQETLLDLLPELKRLGLFPVRQAGQGHQRTHNPHQRRRFCPPGYLPQVRYMEAVPGQS